MPTGGIQMLSSVRTKPNIAFHSTQLTPECFHHLRQPPGSFCKLQASRQKRGQHRLSKNLCRCRKNCFWYHFVQAGVDVNSRYFCFRPSFEAATRISMSGASEKTYMRKRCHTIETQQRKAINFKCKMKNWDECVGL